MANSTSVKYVREDLYQPMTLSRNFNWTKLKTSETKNCYDNHIIFSSQKQPKKYCTITLNIKQQGTADAYSSKKTELNSKTSDKDVIMEIQLIYALNITHTQTSARYLRAQSPTKKCTKPATNMSSDKEIEKLKR